jgi:osmotically inducible protein OsmC
MNTPVAFAMRFENAPGTNPEELIAAAHAVCYCMSLSNQLGKKGHPPRQITARTTVTLDPQQPGGSKITRSRLEVTADVPGLDNEAFRAIAQDAERACPVSNALRAIEIELDARLA